MPPTTSFYLLLCFEVTQSRLDLEVKKTPQKHRAGAGECLGGHWCSARLEVWPPHKSMPPGVWPAELWMARTPLPSLSLPWPWVQASALGISEQEGEVRALHAVTEGWRQLCEEDS